MPAAMNRNFRFGVVGESIRSATELTATARRTEELGYDALVLRDHFVPEPFGDQPAPMVALASAAAAGRPSCGGRRASTGVSRVTDVS